LINKDGKELASSYHGYEVEQPNPGWAQQWPEVWLDAVKKVIKDIVSANNVNPDDIEGIAISSLYGGAGIPVDNKIEPLAPCLIWMDRRAKEETDWVKTNLDLDNLYQITGNTVDSYYGYTKMLWIKNNWPEIWNNTNLFLPPNAYIIYKLTGEIAVDYSSAGNIGGIFDINKKTWSEEMCNKLGIPVDKQPEKLVGSDEIVGEITEAVAEETGLKPGTPVIAGGVDAAVATLSAGAVFEGNHVAMIGTSMCWGFVTEKTNLSSKLVSMPNVIEAQDKVYSFGGAATAGAIIRWFRDVFGQEELNTEEKLGIDAYKLLEIKTEDIPAGSEGLIVLPYFMGERSPIWDSQARGNILGLSLYHTKGHIFKAFMEGVAYALRHNMEIMVDNDQIELDKELLLVGGITKSDIFPQIIADVTGFPVKIIKNDVEAPLGDAVLAGLGTGVFNSPEVLLDWIEFEETFIPDKDNKEVYDKLFEQYKELYPKLKEEMEILSDI